MFRSRFKDIIRVIDRVNHHARERRIITIDLVALDKLRPFLDKPFYEVELAWQRSDPNHCSYL